MSDPVQHRGHCRCGTVSMSSAFVPDFAVYCHCDDCRRATGAPVLASVAFPKDSITWNGRESVSCHTSGTASRLFCKQCGSPIAQEHESQDHLTFFNTGFMDNPEAFPPKAHTFSNQQISWLMLNDDLHRAETTLLINTDSNDGHTR